MKPINKLLTILFILLLSPPSWSETIDDLVERGGLYYKQFTYVPYTGKITGDIQGSFKNGKRDGAWVIYWDNGQLMGKVNFKSGKQEGAGVYYYDNGQLSYRGNYKNGKRDGAWVTYNYDGTVIKSWTGIFKNDVKISD